MGFNHVGGCQRAGGLEATRGLPGGRRRPWRRCEVVGCGEGSGGGGKEEIRLQLSRPADGRAISFLRVR
jgi:hypothetical protein